MANGTECTEVWESDCGPGSSGKLACAHCDIYYSWGNGQSWPREANLNILIAAARAGARRRGVRRRQQLRLRGAFHLDDVYQVVSTLIPEIICIFAAS